MSKPPRINPFYVLLVVVGTAFVVTSSAYGLMAFFDSRAANDLVAPAARHPLFGLMQQYGWKLLLGEVVLLALFSFAAMGTDSYWSHEDATRSDALRASTAVATSPPAASPEQVPTPAPQDAAP